MRPMKMPTSIISDPATFQAPIVSREKEGRRTRCEILIFLEQRRIRQCHVLIILCPLAMGAEVSLDAHVCLRGGEGGVHFVHLGLDVLGRLGGCVWARGVEDRVFGRREEIEDGGQEDIVFLELRRSFFACGWEGGEIDVDDSGLGIVADGERARYRKLSYQQTLFVRLWWLPSMTYLKRQSSMMRRHICLLLFQRSLLCSPAQAHRSRSWSIGSCHPRRRLSSADGAQRIDRCSLRRGRPVG